MFAALALLFIVLTDSTPQLAGKETRRIPQPKSSFDVNIIICIDQ